MIDLSGPCLGAMFFGTKVPADRAYALLDHYLESGGRLIDTANNYAFWVENGTGDESETLLGRWLAARSNRDSVQLATKVGARPRPGSRSTAQAQGLSGPAVRSQVTGSLQRLGVDRIDLLYAHIDDHDTPLAETLAAFDALVREGLVGTIACSNYTGPRLQEALTLSAERNLARYAADQLRATYLAPAPDADFGVQVSVDADTLSVARRNDVTVFGYSSLLAGGYAGRALPPEYQHDQTQAQLGAVRSVADRLGVTANQTVLAWLRSQGIVPVLGVSRIEQLDEALAGLSISLDADSVAELDAARA